MKLSLVAIEDILFYQTRVQILAVWYKALWKKTGYGCSSSIQTVRRLCNDIWFWMYQKARMSKQTDPIPLFSLVSAMQPETFPSAKLNLSTTPEFTDLSRWRLRVERGAQTWHYLESDEECKAWPQTFWDKYHLGLPVVCPAKEFIQLIVCPKTDWYLYLLHD